MGLADKFHHIVGSSFVYACFNWRPLEPAQWLAIKLLCGCPAMYGCSAEGFCDRGSVQVRARQLWGNEVYTQDSDLVAVLMHCGFYNHALSAPPASAAHVRAVVQPLPPQPAYHSRARNSIRSRAWGAAVEGCSYRVRHQPPPIVSKRCCIPPASGRHLVHS